MSYQVIARKWRPQTFEEVTGQEPITQTLRNAVEHDRLHHAYIFSGARGVGKTSTARLFAKALNCHKSDKPTPTPCRTDDKDICHSCREIAESRSIDVLEIDAASTTGVQNVRDSIIDTIGISPARDRYKVFIIDEVHMLTTQAFNALLKTLEEPPPRVVFIMATTEGHKLPDTIVSRCQQFEFRTIASSKIAERLRFIASEEKLSITDDALREIARAGEGSMRDAQSALDQIISFSGSDIKAEDVEAALGMAGVDVLENVMTAVVNASSAEVLAVVDDLVMRGHDLRNFCRDLMAYIRDLLVAKATDGAAGVLDLSEAEHAEMVERATAFSESDLVRFFHSLTETESSLKDAAHPRYQLEVGLIKLIEMRRLAPLQKIIERLETLEHTFGSASPGSSGPTTPPVTQSGKSSAGKGRTSSAQAKTATAGNASPSSEPEAKIVTNDELPGVVRDDLGQRPNAFDSTAQAEPISLPAAIEVKTSDVPASIVDQIKSALDKKSRPFLVTAIDAARRVAMEGNELVMEFPSDAKHLRDNLATPDNIKVLREIGRELVGHEIGVRISVSENDGNESHVPVSREDERRLDKKRLREAAEKNPAVQQILKTFHGEIVDVRREERTLSAGQEPD